MTSNFNDREMTFILYKSSKALQLKGHIDKIIFQVRRK